MQGDFKTFDALFTLYKINLNFVNSQLAFFISFQYYNGFLTVFSVVHGIILFFLSSVSRLCFTEPVPIRDSCVPFNMHCIRAKGVLIILMGFFLFTFEAILNRNVSKR